MLLLAGGDLAARDVDGNTPLHDLCQTAASDKGNLEKYLAVWDTIVENCVIWWCRQPFWKKPVPDMDSPNYQICKFDAMFMLRTELANNKHLSVLQFAADLGMPELVNYMITDENVFVEEIPLSDDVKQDLDTVFEERQEYMINITHLVPEFSKNYGRIHYMKGRACSRDLIMAVCGHKYLDVSSLEESIAKMEKPVDASLILQEIPMEDLARKKWMTYQWLYIFLLLLHVALMAWFSYESSEYLAVALRSTANGSVPAIETNIADLVIFGYAVLILLILLVKFLMSTVEKKWDPIVDDETLSAESKLKARKNREYSYYLKPLSAILAPMYQTDSDFVEDKGSFLNLPIYILAFVATNMTILITLAFCGCMIASFMMEFTYGQTADEIYQYADVKCLAMIFGWLLVVFPARSFSPIYNFTTMLKYIFLRVS